MFYKSTIRPYCFCHAFPPPAVWARYVSLCLSLVFYFHQQKELAFWVPESCFSSCALFQFQHYFDIWCVPVARKAFLRIYRYIQIYIYISVPESAEQKYWENAKLILQFSWWWMGGSIWIWCHVSPFKYRNPFQYPFILHCFSFLSPLRGRYPFNRHQTGLLLSLDANLNYSTIRFFGQFTLNYDGVDFCSINWLSFLSLFLGQIRHLGPSFKPR